MTTRRLVDVVVASAALALQVLGCALALRFTWIGVDAVLLASSHKLKRTSSLGISVAVTGIASLLLIPRMGIPGAAIARLVGSVAQLVFSLGGANVPLSITRVVVLIGWPIAIAVGCFFVAGPSPAAFGQYRRCSVAHALCTACDGLS